MVRRLLKVVRNTSAASRCDILIVSAGKSGSTYLSLCISKKRVHHVHSLVSDFYFKFKYQKFYQKVSYQVLLRFTKLVWWALTIKRSPSIIVFPYRDNEQHRRSLLFNDFEDFVFWFKTSHKKEYRISRYKNSTEFLSCVQDVMVAENPTERFFNEWRYILGDENLRVPVNDSPVLEFFKRKAKVFIVSSEALTEFVKNHDDIFDSPTAGKVNQSEEFWWSPLYVSFKNERE